jgi:hypothetical protein
MLCPLRKAGSSVGISAQETVMTASISIKDDSLLVDLEGADKFCALKNRLQIPVAHVTGATYAESEARK